jgi:hypothetical protein
MLFSGENVVWIAGGAGVLLVLAVFLVIQMARSSGKSKTKPSPAMASKGPPPPQTARNDGSKPAPVSPPSTERATPIGREFNKGAMTEGAQKEASLKPNNSMPQIAPLHVNQILGDFGDPSAWRNPGGKPPPPGLHESAYALGPRAGVQSAQSLEVHPGEKFIVEYTVRMVAAPKNGKPAAYVVGPMFRDAADKVLSWGSIEAPFGAIEHSGRIEKVAPPTATRVHLYIGGLWAAEEPQPDGVIAYTKATLRVAKPEQAELAG